MADNRSTISCEVVETIGTISTNAKTGWNKLLQRCKWNGSDEVKFDIRDHAPDDPERISRGITLTDAEARQLSKLLAKHFK